MKLRRLKNLANLRILTGVSTTTALIITASWFYSDRSHEPLLAMLTSLGAFLSTFKYSFLSFDRNLVGDRIALVIGNRTYQNSPPLVTSANDADAVCAALSKLGFRTIKRIDPTTAELRKAIYDFQTILSVGGVGLFYYAGHAAQIEGSDYILPVDAVLKSHDDFRAAAINLNELLGPVDRIIDDSPVHNGSIAIYSTTSGGEALDFFVPQPVEKPKAKEVLGAESPGEVSPEKEPPRHSPFATHFLALCTRWNLEIFDLFRELCRELPRATNHMQIPWVSASVDTEFYFKPIIRETVGVLKLRSLMLAALILSIDHQSTMHLRRLLTTASSELKSAVSTSLLARPTYLGRVEAVAMLELLASPRTAC